jgi:hypothetical protein
MGGIRGARAALAPGAPVNPIGGEIHHRHDAGLHTYFTDSGRSSLRLILKSGFAQKRFLLPDFLCGVISRVFDELEVRYAYYRVRPDLSIDPASVAGQTFDVLYVIHYFGARQDYRGLVGNGSWVLEDCVFLPVVEPPPQAERWLGFNSFRKISHLVEGSLLRSTAPLSGELIAREPAAFAALKSAAKRMKAEYLEEGRHSEAQYLALFEQGERAIDRQAGIHAIADTSLVALLGFYRNLDAEYRARSANYRAAERRLERFGVPLRADYPCLYVLRVERRDELREHLRAQRIFLPVHWPNAAAPANDLYDTIISVPVDSRYGEQDMDRVACAIEEFFRAR